MISSSKRLQALLPGLAGMALLLYGLAYEVDRSQFGILLTLFTGLFAAYGWLYRNIYDKNDYYLAIGGAVLLRLLLLPAIPWLSDDVFRFIWDGRLLAQGVDPFAHTPRWFIEHPEALNTLTGIDESLFAKINSPDYYTVYPPFCQGIFALAGWLFPNNELGAIVTLRSFMLLAEIITLLLMEKIRRYFQWSYGVVVLYALNPLVIAELTGNLHFEGFMITMLLGSFWFLLQNKKIATALSFSGAVLTKLLPVIFLPSLLRRLGWTATFSIGFLSCFMLVATLFLISSPQQLWHMAQSLDLYFQTFEFNASIYYIARWIGFQYDDYNMIGTIGPLLGGLSAFIILLLAWKANKPALKDWPQAIVIVYTVYLAFATTVHPWYVTPLVAFSMFTRYWFPLIWSFTVLLSYATYQTTNYEEKLWLTTLSYIIVYSAGIWEIWQKRD